VKTTAAATIETVVAISENTSRNFRIVAPLCVLKERFMGPQRCRLCHPVKLQVVTKCGIHRRPP
jgi:hypothetical protein